MPDKSQTDLRQYIKVYQRFLSHPVREIRSLPDWSWRELFFNQVALTSATGAIAGFLKTSILSVAQGMIVVPVITSVTILVGSLFFYFLFQIMAGQTLPFRKLIELMFFANIPFFIFQTVAYFFPPISLFGLAMSAMLLIVGFVENFQLERKIVIRTIVGVYALFILVWLWSRIEALRFESKIDRSIDSP
ncbi:MAG: hypothetical protein C5B49_01870, partial [Bdellovibrio sp.]